MQGAIPTSLVLSAPRQPYLGGVKGELRHAVQARLLHQIAPMVHHGINAYAKFGRDFLGA